MIEKKLHQMERFAQQLPKGPDRIKALQAVARHREARKIGLLLAYQARHRSGSIRVKRSAISICKD